MFLEVLILGVLTAFLTIFINYCIGKPGSEKFSPYEIFSFYTVWLSKRRLKQVGLYFEYEQQYKDNLKRLITKSGIITLKNDYKKIYYEAAEPFFTWERAAGMCPVCSGVWISVIAGAIIAKDLIDILIVVLISHIIIRLLTKII